MDDRPGKEIPKEYRDVVAYQIDRHRWRYDNARRRGGHPMLYPANRSKRPIRVPTTPSDQHCWQNFISEVRRLGAPGHRGRQVKGGTSPMDDFSVFVDTSAPVPAGPAHGPEFEAEIDALMDLLAEHHGVVSGDGRGWGAVVSVDAHTADDAYTVGMAVIRAAAGKAGLPDWPVTDVRVVRGDVLAEENSKPNKPDLVSGPEAAVILGVNRQRVHQLAHEHPDFPKPLYRLGVGSLWDRGAIEDFAVGWERKPGRPRKHPANA